MLDFWYNRSTDETDQYSLLHKEKIRLTFKEHVELALEWALADDKVEQVKMLKPLIDDFPFFVYGPKTCRREEGYGTTLAELYEYEDNPQLTAYLEPLLEFKKKPPTFAGKTIHAYNEERSETIKNVQEVNDVRLRRIWSLVLQLLYDDDDMEAPEDSNFPFEDKSESKKVGYKSTRKFAFTPHQTKCPQCDMGLKDHTMAALNPNCGQHSAIEIKKSDTYKHDGGGCDDWHHKNGKSIDVTTDRTLQSVWELVQQKRDKTASASKKNHADLLANQELMIWAVLFNRYELAVFFWQEGGYAIPNALLASRLFLGMAQHQKLTSKGRLADRVLQMNDMAEKFEALAIGNLAKCYEENADTSQDVLEAKLTPYDWMGRVFPGKEKKFDDCLDLAFLAKNMDFVEHVACQAVIDRKWRGGRSHSVKHTADGTLIPSKYNKGKGFWVGFGSAGFFGLAVGAAIGTVFFPNPEEAGRSEAERAAMSAGNGLVFRHGVGIGAGAFGLFFAVLGGLVGSKVLFASWDWPVIINRLVAPRIKFYMDFAQTFLMVLLQSYIVLGDLSIKQGDDLGSTMLYEHVLAAWILVLIGEEVRQTFDDGWNRVYLRRYIEDVWNKMDIVIYIVFTVTYVLRIRRYESGDALLYKGLYASNCLLSWMRIFKYAGASEGIGPKINILAALVGSLMQYMLLLGVFIISFGIFTEAIANPAFPLGGNRAQGHRDWEITIHNVIYRPYFQMYGELMLEDISSETKCIGAPFTNCSSLFESLVLPFLTGVYMIVTSLMLMNMLIADFTLTFEAQFEESSKIFKMSRFQLLTEYDNKPWLPVPLSVFEIIRRFIMNLPELWTVMSGFWICQCCPGRPPCHACLDCLNLREKPKMQTADQVEEDRRIEDFQDRCCDTFLAEQDQNDWRSVESRVERIEGEMLHAKKELAFFKGKSYSAGIRTRDAASSIERMKAENVDFPMFPRCTIDHTLDALNEDKFKKSRVSRSPSAKTWRRLHTDEKLRELMKLEHARDEKDANTPMMKLKKYHGDIGEWCIIRGAYKNNSVYQGMASQVADTETKRMLDVSIYSWTDGAKLGRRCSIYQEVAMDTELDICNSVKCRCRSVRQINGEEMQVTVFNKKQNKIELGAMCKSENPGCRYRAFERYDQSLCTNSTDCLCGRSHEQQPSEAEAPEEMLKIREETGFRSLLIEERNPLPNPFQFYDSCNTCREFSEGGDEAECFGGVMAAEDEQPQACFEAAGCKGGWHCKKRHPHSRKFNHEDASKTDTRNDEKIHIMRKMAPYGTAPTGPNGEWQGYDADGDACTQHHCALWDGIDPVDKNGIVIPNFDHRSTSPDAFFLRGTLPEYGRNHFICHIVTRWKKDDMGIIIDRGGKRLMQFVGFKRHLEDNKWSIPSLLMNRATEQRDLDEEKAKKEKDLEVMREKLKNAYDEWQKVKKDIDNKQIETTEKEEEDYWAPAESHPRCEKIKQMLEDDQKSKYYEKSAEMVHEKRAMQWDSLIDQYRQGYNDFKLAKVQFNEAKAAPSDDCRGIEKKFSKGYSACAHHAFHKKNFKTTVSAPQQKFVEDQMAILFDAHYSTGTSRRSAPYVGKMIYEGFMDDERNFGMAYSFVTVFITHDEEGVLDAYNLSSTATDRVEREALVRLTEDTEQKDMYDVVVDNERHPPPAEAAWLTMHRDLDLTGEEEDLLEHVAKIHNAYW